MWNVHVSGVLFSSSVLVPFNENSTINQRIKRRLAALSRAVASDSNA